MKIWFSHFFTVTLSNFFKRFALKTRFQQISFAKSLKVRKPEFLSEISNFYSIYLSMCAPIAYNGRRLGAVAASTNGHAGYYRSITHGFFCGLPPPLRQTACCVAGNYLFSEKGVQVWHPYFNF